MKQPKEIQALAQEPFIYIKDDLYNFIYAEGKRC